jgi:hypothetical protein
MQEDICFSQQALQKVSTGWPRGIERNSALVGIEVEKQAAALRIGDIAWKRTMMPRGIARAGGLDLDHLRPEVSQHLAAGRRRDRGAVFDDAESAKRARCHAGCFEGSRTTARPGAVISPR